MKAAAIFCLVIFSAGVSDHLARADAPADHQSVSLPKLPGAKARSVVLIVSDDHRYDALGVAGHPFLETPHLDALARHGAHLRNAFVTTSLCSPSRASILTGLYAHRHRVVDNNNPVPPGLTFFPQHLQAAGYDTAFIGKWHMGSDSDAPQPGFGRWVSFTGQGTYWPNPNGLEVGPLTGDVASQLGMKDAQGLVITAVEPGSLADLAGLSESMVVAQVNRKPVTSVDEFEAAIKNADLEKGVLLLVRTAEGSRFVVLKKS